MNSKSLKQIAKQTLPDPLYHWLQTQTLQFIYEVSALTITLRAVKPEATA